VMFDPRRTLRIVTVSPVELSTMMRR